MFYVVLMQYLKRVQLYLFCLLSQPVFHTDMQNLISGINNHLVTGSFNSGRVTELRPCVSVCDVPSKVMKTPIMLCNSQA